MSRPKYDDVDNDDRFAQLSSRTKTINKSFVTDLWMKVLHRAIDDLVLCRFIRESGKTIKPEDLELEESAYKFLFDDEYRIPFDDYNVFVTCSVCEDNVYEDRMSIVAAGESKCDICHVKQSEKILDYDCEIADTQIKDISLRELLSLWNINDINGFRIGTRKRIEELVMKKKAAAATRAKAKPKTLRVVEKLEENFIPPTEEELTDFDKGIMKVLEDTKNMLMEKNRKYGNSATKPVRAFSKSDPEEQIKVRIDDKISRLIRSKSKVENEDVVKDLIGYLVILAALQRGYI